MYIRYQFSWLAFFNFVGFPTVLPTKSFHWRDGDTPLMTAYSLYCPSHYGFPPCFPTTSFPYRDDGGTPLMATQNTFVAVAKSFTLNLVWASLVESANSLGCQHDGNKVHIILHRLSNIPHKCNILLWPHVSYVHTTFTRCTVTPLMTAYLFLTPVSPTRTTKIRLIGTSLITTPFHLLHHVVLQTPPLTTCLEHP